MTKEELAAKLNGREYTNEITDAEEKEAKNDGLVVIFGASDDLVELRGAIYDEVGAWNGGEVLIGTDGALPQDIYDDEKEILKKHGVLQTVLDKRKGAIRIEVPWDAGNGYSWEMKTEAPHAAFDVMEDGEKFCRGIVIDLKELCK